MHLLSPAAAAGTEVSFVNGAKAATSADERAKFATDSVTGARELGVGRAEVAASASGTETSLVRWAKAAASVTGTVVPFVIWAEVAASASNRDNAAAAFALERAPLLLFFLGFRFFFGLMCCGTKVASFLWVYHSAHRS